MPADPRDYRLDLTGAPEPATPAPPRPWLGVRFDCCGVYQRVYLHRDGTRYEGRCPKCLRTIGFRVGPGGSATRQFVAK